MPPERAHFRLEELAPGLHAAFATVDGHGLCNAAIVDLGGATLVFDAMLTPQAGAALGLAARRLTGRPVDFLVDSHYHGDHVRGNGAVAARHIVSTHKVRDVLIERSGEALASDRKEAAAELEALRAGRTTASPEDRAIYEGWFEGILATPADWSVALPDLTFSDEITLRGSRRTARVVSFGGGHSPSDVLVELADERVGFLGDLLLVGFHPSLWDGHLATLARILERVDGLRLDRLLPGHGPLGGPADLARMRTYVDEIARRGRARAAAPPGDTPAAASPAPAPFDRWKFAAFFETNVAFAARTLAAPVP